METAIIILTLVKVALEVLKLLLDLLKKLR